MYSYHASLYEYPIIYTLTVCCVINVCSNPESYALTNPYHDLVSVLLPGNIFVYVATAMQLCYTEFCLDVAGLFWLKAVNKCKCQSININGKDVF